MSLDASTEQIGDSYEFNYRLWTADTRVELFNVPWNADYRDIVRFPDNIALDAYLRERAGPFIRLDNATRARVGQPVDIDIPFNSAYRYNYLRVHNPSQPVNGDSRRNFYYFILDVEDIAPNTTRMHIQLDVWQTFGYDIKFGSCYVERGHIGIANENSFTGYGRDYLTEPEGMDLGGEYRIVDIWSRKLASARASTAHVPDYSVLVVSTVDLSVDPGTATAPILVTASGNEAENLPNGANAYIFQTVADFRTFANTFKDRPHMLQGIVSITAIPDEYNLPAQGVGNNLLELRAGTLKSVQTSMKTNWRDTINMKLPARYRHLKKFLTFPYLMIEMTANTGTPIVIKPESWQNASATVIENPHFASSGARVMFSPLNYNADGVAQVVDSNGIVRDGGEFLDFATGIFNFPQFSVVNNGYMQYIAANTNSIAYSQQSADWSQQKALTGNSTSYDQATANMQTTEEMNRLGVNAAASQTDLQNNLASAHTGMSILGAGAGLAGGAVGVGLGVANAASALANSTIGTMGRNQANAISANLSNAQTATGVGNQAFMRDTNKNYADYAARGDYSNTIAGIQAKLQDARMIQPTTAGQVGGDAFLLARYQWGYDLKVKLLDPHAMAKHGEFWLRYGYPVNRFVQKLPETLHCMTAFTYWKLRETYITSSACPESFKQAIRGIFEKGVTVWSNPDDIGNIDTFNNSPIAGIRL